MNPYKTLEFSKKDKIPVVDLLSTWQHFSIPVEVFTETCM
jgi:hypothetical protein